MKRTRRSSALAHGLAALAAICCLSLSLPPAALAQDLILVGQNIPGCIHETIFEALGKRLLPGYRVEVINLAVSSTDCQGLLYGPAPSMEWAMNELLKRPPTVVYFGFILIPKPLPQSRIAKLLDAVAKRHVLMIPGGNGGVDSCEIGPAGPIPLHVGFHIQGTLDRTPEQAKCIDLFVDGSSEQVTLRDGTTWAVAGTSTTAFLSAVQAARMRRELRLTPEKIRPAFKLGGALLSKEDLFAPRVGTATLTRETRGGKTYSVISGTVAGPAPSVQIFRGVSCGAGAPLLTTVVHANGRFRYEAKALLNNVCLRVPGSSAPPAGASFARTP